MLNGLGKFAAASAMPVVFNLAVLAVLLGFATRLSAPAHVLAWGIAAAGAAQLVFVGRVLPAGGHASRAGAAHAPGEAAASAGRRRRWPGSGPRRRCWWWTWRLRRCWRRGRCRMCTMPGGWRGCCLRSPGRRRRRCLLPYLARSGAREGAAKTGAANRTLEAVLLLGVPGAVALAVIAEPAVAGLLQRGAFGAPAVAGTAAALTAYAGAVPAWMLLGSLGAVCFARGDTVTPMVAALGAALVNLVLSLALMGPLGHVGIALATSVAVWMQSGFLAVSLARRGAFAPDRRLYARAGAIAAASALMAGALWLARLALGDTPDAGGLERIVGLGVLVAAGLGCFAVAALATGAVRWRELGPRAAVGK